MPRYQGRKLNRKQREVRLAQVASLYLANMRQYKIADRLQVSVGQISYDLGTLKRRWHNQIEGFKEALGEQVAKLDEIEREAWEAWEESKLVGVQSKTERKIVEGSECESDAYDRAQLRYEDQYGDPRYLHRVEACISRRCKLLGIDASTKIAPTDPSGKTPYIGLTDEERVSRIVAMLETARVRKEQQEQTIQ